MATKYVQAPTLYIAGSGTLIGATTVTLTSLTDIYGNVLTMADFGAKGYITLDPDTNNEEAAIFTGITANPNGTYTLTGVSTILAKDPYTEASGLVRQHSGGLQVVITDNVGFWNTFGNTKNTNTWDDVQTFNEYPQMDSVAVPPTLDEQLATKKYVDDIAIAGAPDASTTVKGIVQEGTQTQVDNGTAVGSTSARLFVNPSRLRSRKLSDYDADTGIVNAIAITPTPSISAYAVGQRFNTIVAVTNTGATTVSVSGLAATPLMKLDGVTPLVAGDLVAGQAIEVEYDASGNFQLLVPTANTVESAPGGEITVPLVPVNPTDAASKQYVDNTVSITVPLGESFTGGTSPQPAYIQNDLWQPYYQSNTSEFGTSTTAISATARKRAIKIIPRSNVTAQTVRSIVMLVGSPADNVFVTIETDSAGSPSGTPVTNGTSNVVAAGTFSTSELRFATFSFASAFTLSADTTYWVVIQRDGALSDTNRYVVGSASQSYSAFTGMRLNSSNAWESAAGILPYMEMIPTTGGSYSLWKTDANGEFETKLFDGFVTTTGSAGDDGTLYTSGLVGGFSGLSPFSNYYASTTAGDIGLTTTGAPVGIAVSATSIKIPSQKEGAVMPMVSGTTNRRYYRFHRDGTFMIEPGSGSSVLQFDTNIADDISFSVNAWNRYTTFTSSFGMGSVSIPVRKGQYLDFNPNDTDVTSTFIPKSI